MGANNVQLIGRATNIPKLEVSEKGHAYCKVRMAVSRPYKHKIKNPESAKDTDFFNVMFWGNAGKYMAKNLVKGAKFYVSGRMQQDTWRDASQFNRESVSVCAEKFEILDPRRKEVPAQLNTGEFEDLNLVPREIADTLFDRDFLMDEDIPEDFR